MTTRNGWTFSEDAEAFVATMGDAEARVYKNRDAWMTSAYLGKAVPLWVFDELERWKRNPGSPPQSGASS